MVDLTLKKVIFQNGGKTTLESGGNMQRHLVNSTCDISAQASVSVSVSVSRAGRERYSSLDL